MLPIPYATQLDTWATAQLLQMQWMFIQPSIVLRPTVEGGAVGCIHEATANRKENDD